MLALGGRARRGVHVVITLAALPGHPLARHIDDFLADLANANKPRNTIRAYRGDLTRFAVHYDGDIGELTAAPVRAFLGEIAGQAPSTRKRKRAAVASFCRWAVRHDLLDASPMDRIDAIEVPRTLPRPAAAADIAAVLDAICSRRPRKDVPLGVLRDRVLFETAYVCGARASEVYGAPGGFVRAGTRPGVAPGNGASCPSRARRAPVPIPSIPGPRS
jgi:integrase/recombinase XerD